MQSSPTVVPAARRRKLLLLGIGVPILLVVLVLWFLGWPRIGPTTISSRGGIVSLTVPAGWTAKTPWNARQISTPLVGGPYRVADIELAKGSFWSDTYLSVYLDAVPIDAKLAELHAVNQSRSFGLREHAVPIASPVGYWESLASTGKRFDGRTEVVTARSDSYVVAVFAVAPDEAGLRAAHDVIATIKIHDSG